MYTEYNLSQFPFFEELLKEKEISSILDPMTGLITRSVIIEFVKHLIEENIPFTLSILDLDNFKSINDNFGHAIGDVILKDVSTSLVNYVKDEGVVGRLGGDEFFVILLKATEYDEIHGFYEKMILSHAVLRKTVELPSCSPYVVGTIGCAAFPRNAQDFSSLFELVDKALYRGKIKGRNCFIVYVEEKHKNLEISKLAHLDLDVIFYEITKMLEKSSNIYEGIKGVFNYLSSNIHITNLFYVNNKQEIYDCMDHSLLGTVENFDSMVELYDQDLSTIQVNDADIKNPSLVPMLKKFDLHSLLISRIETADMQYGYIMYGENLNTRIWQGDEKSLLYYVAKMIGYYLCTHPDETF